MPDAILEVEQLTKRFGGVIASDGISLAIPKGELHAIIGPNGAGKTTLIAQLAGEIAPDAGCVRFEQRDITIGVDLGVGSEAARAWGTDLSAEYVRINAEYTT